MVIPRIAPFIKFLLILYLFAVSFASKAQSTKDNFIKYDIKTQKTDKPIPFDKSFKLNIPDIPSKNVTNVHLYEARTDNNKRTLVENCYIDYNGKWKSSAIIDDTLNIDTLSGELQINIPPLKPNKEFDINIITLLSDNNRAIIMKVNAFLQEAKDKEAKSTYKELEENLKDKFTQRTYLSLSYNDYKSFYAKKLRSAYLFLNDNKNLSITDDLTLEEIRALDISTSKEVSNYKDAYFLIELYKKKLYNDLQIGLIDITKIFQKDYITTKSSVQLRALNYASNIKYFDTLQRRLNRVISKGGNSIKIGTKNLDLFDLRTKIDEMRTNLLCNAESLKKQLKIINSEIDGQNEIREGRYIAADNLSTDLKTAGGTILYLDAGITNMAFSGIKGNIDYIPKVFWGVSIYFRPIDKNTRRNKLPTKFDPPQYDGWHKVTGSKDTKENIIYGPDYGVVAKTSILQHLSLNLGFTLGAMQNSQYANLYNNMSLLIGPAYRFHRAYKVSAGASVAKRDSKSPLISEKGTVVGGYMALSVDIDFIQGLKDITSLLFK